MSVSTELPPILSLDAIPHERFVLLSEAFQKHTGSSQFDFAVRAPGRVNIIGEHIDYSGYAVLPMAIDNDTMVAVRLHDNTADRKIVLHHVQSDKFASREFPLADADLIINKQVHEWSNYFMAGYKGLLQHMKIASGGYQSFTAVVHGTVPMGSGLSSSSSLVCAATLATARANHVTLPKKELATLCARSEQYVGTEGGGMDQAISFLAMSGQAELIEFDPLTNHPVKLPEGASFVIANSLAESHKYLTASTCFNMRVVECRLAAVVLSRALSLPKWKEVRRLIHVQQQTNMDFTKLIETVKLRLHEQPYTLEEIAQLLDMDENAVRTQYIGDTVKSQSFDLFKRALHVYSEAQRVYAFRDACQSVENKSSSEETLATLGKLMNESHVSCSQVFECSCPELDKLTDICRASGALGSRLTGAGWGGCTISLVPSSQLSTFIQQVKHLYYQEFLGRDSGSSNTNGENQVIFATSPSSGAAVFANL